MKIENKINNEVYVTGDNYIIVIPVKSTNVLCPDSARSAYLLDTEGNKIEYIFGDMKSATYGHGFPEPSRLELDDVIVNGKSSWTTGGTVSQARSVQRGQNSMLAGVPLQRGIH